MSATDDGSERAGDFHRSIVCRTLLAFALVAAFAVVAPAAAAPVLYGLALPESIAGAQIGEVVDFDNDAAARGLGLGYSVKYLRSGWIINFYIYDLNRAAIPDDLRSEVVRSDFERSKSEIVRYRGQVALRREFPIADAGGRMRFICASYTYLDRGTEIDSLLCQTTWRNKFIKFRVSTARHAGSEAEAMRFVQAWSNVLWGTQG